MTIKKDPQYSVYVKPCDIKVQLYTLRPHLLVNPGVIRVKNSFETFNQKDSQSVPLRLDYFMSVCSTVCLP